MGDKRKMNEYMRMADRMYDLENQMKQLEKENAELKAQLESERDLPAIAYMQGAEKQKKKDEEELKKWKDEWQEKVQEATDEGYARTLQTMQLTKAKEIIQSFLRWHTGEDRGSSRSSDLVEQAEQFLNEVEL
jgi:flagellar biosynthesis/type III secretory pathway protein FliH